MALDTDELAPPPKPVRLDLDVMSIEALAERITTLEAEIAQIRELIAAKRKSRDAAAALFRS
jgi:uncharacterized small protein (DUF1192 family)